MAELTSGTYRPNDNVEVIAWAEGDTPPEGFDVETTSDGSKVAVRKERGEVVRDPDGNAASVPEGGALVTYGDGRMESLSAEQAEDFARRYVSASGTRKQTAPAKEGTS